jgi:hypothetical protein
MVSPSDMFVARGRLGIRITLSESSAGGGNVDTPRCRLPRWRLCRGVFRFPREVLCLRPGRYKHVGLVVVMVLVLCVVPSSSSCCLV